MRKSILFFSFAVCIFVCVAEPLMCMTACGQKFDVSEKKYYARKSAKAKEISFILPEINEQITGKVVKTLHYKGMSITSYIVIVTIQSYERLYMVNEKYDKIISQILLSEYWPGPYGDYYKSFTKRRNNKFITYGNGIVVDEVFDDSVPPMKMSWMDRVIYALGKLRPIQYHVQQEYIIQENGTIQFIN